jgi:signal transduction histidine kinase
MAPAATARAERLLSVAVAVGRLGTLLPVPAALSALAGGPRFTPVAWIAAGAAVESLVIAAVCLRAGGPRRSWIVADLLVVAVVVALSAGPPLLPAPAIESPLYNFALSAAIVAGLADWPWWAAALAPIPLSIATIAPLALAADRAYPVWSVIPDAVAIPCAALVAWPVAWLLRRSARAYQQHQALTLRRAETLARERERTRQSQALRSHLLGTLDAVVAAGVTDPVMAGQLRQETLWLHQVVEVGLADPPPDLIAGLHDLAAEKTIAGLRVTLESPPAVPELPASTRQALLDATRESLTNVAKHAGVAAATVRVTVTAAQLTVEVIDRGRGYDPAVCPPGTGQSGSIRARLVEVGGAAEVDTAPGRGTRVVLRVPAAQP